MRLTCMTTLKLNQLENLSVLSSDAQTHILGGRKGWLKRLFKKKHPETEHPNGDDKGNQTNDPNHDKNDDHGHNRGGKG
jgi:hypothetical protein